MKITKNKILSLFLILQIVFVKWIVNYPVFVEKFYANGIYKNISSGLRLLFGWLPFSFGDILYFVLIIWILKNSIRFFRQKQKEWYKLFFAITAKFSIIYFIFHLFWGFNYYRLPLQKSMSLKIPRYNIDDLSLLTEKLLIKTQKIHFQITKNDTLSVLLDMDTETIFNKASQSYETLAKVYPQFKYKRSKVKKSMLSLPLTYMGFSGYLNPFTNEAQVNYKVPKYTLPAIATHEIAHQLGYASESEANFIGFLAATKSNDLYLKYAGFLTALQYCLNEIYRSDGDLYKEFVSRLPIGVKKNLEQNRKFWNKYENPFEPLFKVFYDLFLKSNHQKSGIRSYGKMVGLLMAYELKNKL
ncbi:MAG: DUF3810 domain-containing protein [Flavobacteriaceae bacterium]|nr:DUF3810 domain-containing protein [Flavobacteriaceae bacterium]